MGFLYSQYSEDDKAELMKLFQGVEWQVALTGRVGIDKQTSVEQIEGLIARWHTLAAKQTSLQIGLSGVLVSHNGLHVHALVVSKNRHGLTLNDLDEDQVDGLKRLWFSLLGGTCRLKNIYDLEGAKQYITNNRNMINQSATVIKPIGMPLLKSLKRESRRKAV
jgi:hypothetical protein